MTVEIRGLRIDPALRSKITADMTEALERVHKTAASAVVAFYDDNGPKNAPGIRCALTIGVPRHPPIRIERVDVTKRAAFDLAWGALSRRLHDEAERLRDAYRRPKKYFAARRLLTPPLTK
jgi:hypothetical protein